jgi:hypothetical protein
MNSFNPIIRTESPSSDRKRWLTNTEHRLRSLVDRGALWLGSVLLLSLLAAPSAGAAAAEKTFTPESDLAGSWAFAPDPALPDVLLIGDSISIGYTRPVRAMLKGRANVFRIMSADGRQPGNGGDTRMGLEGIEPWLAGHHWRVIHFNWGMWDFCYRNPASTEHGNRDKHHGMLPVSPDDYALNLEKLIVRLKATGAELIWASTTIVPDGEPGRFTGDEIKYNKIAAAVMARHGIRTDDLYALSAAMPAEKFRAPADVHFTKEGYDDLARQVSATIVSALTPANHVRSL